MLTEITNEFVSSANLTHANEFTERVFGYLLITIGLFSVLLGVDYLSNPRPDLYLNNAINDESKESEETDNG